MNGVKFFTENGGQSASSGNEAFLTELSYNVFSLFLPSPSGSRFSRLSRASIAFRGCSSASILGRSRLALQQDSLQISLGERKSVHTTQRLRTMSAPWRSGRARRPSGRRAAGGGRAVVRVVLVFRSGSVEGIGPARAVWAGGNLSRAVSILIFG